MNGGTVPVEEIDPLLLGCGEALEAYQVRFDPVSPGTTDESRLLGPTDHRRELTAFRSTQRNSPRSRTRCSFT